MDAQNEQRVKSETPHGIVDLANAGGNAPIDANPLAPNEQQPLPARNEDGTAFSDIGGNTSAGPRGSVHNAIGGGNMATSPIGANDKRTRDLNRDVVPDPQAAEVGGARGNQSDEETNKLTGDEQSRPLPSRMQDATRERKAS